MLSAVRQGQGETVLLLHSGGMSSRQWRRLGERLSNSFHVVIPDLLGCGSNPPWPDEEPFEIWRDVEALEQLISAPCHVVGHSYGGLLALLLARRRPVLSIAAYDPVAMGVLHAAHDVEGQEDLLRIGSDPLFYNDAIGGREPWMRVFVDYWNGPGSWQALSQESRDAFLRVGRKVYYEVRSLMSDRTTVAEHAAITASTLLLYGEKTPASARRVVALLGEAMPNATVRAVAGAGHMGPITHADTVNDLIVGFLEKFQSAKIE